MYGYRARIGLIIPASNTTCEPEIAALCPEGVTSYATRIFFDPSSVDGLFALKKEADRAARELSCESICQIILFCCTSGSMVGGLDYDKRIIEVIEKECGTPAIATATAVFAALAALQVKRVAVATPYPGEVNSLIKETIEANGYKVTRLGGVHEHLSSRELKNVMIGRLQPEAAYELALKVNSKENDAIFISCTNFRAIEIIDRLERETSKPVITSNQATLWHALRKLGLNDSVKGYGRLLEYC